MLRRFVLFCILILTAGLCPGQVDTGRITGVVTDSTGAVIAGAIVPITGEDTQLQYAVESNSAGLFVSPGLRTGRYRVSVEKEGFRTEIRTGVEVRIQDRIDLNFTLNVAATQAEVTVAAEMPLLQSQSSSLAQVIQPNPDMIQEFSVQTSTLSAEFAGQLHRLLQMTVDIGETLLRTLAAEGVILTESILKNLLAKYVRMAEDTISRYHADAFINGLLFDRHEEEVAIMTFAKGLKMACKSYWSDPLGIPLIPNWNRVASAIPGFMDELVEAVEQDNRDAGR